MEAKRVEIVVVMAGSVWLGCHRVGDKETLGAPRPARRDGGHGEAWRVYPARGKVRSNCPAMR